MDTRDEERREIQSETTSRAREFSAFGIAIAAIKSCPRKILVADHYADYADTGLCPCREADLKRRRQPQLIRSILDAVKAYYEIDDDDLASQRRSPDSVLPRHVACYLLRHLSDKTLMTIGGYVGMGDHSTVVAACSKIRLKIDASASFKREVDYITELAFQMETAMGETREVTAGGGSRPLPVLVQPDRTPAISVRAIGAGR